MSRKRISPIPNRKAWGELDDLDVRYAFNLYGGKPISEMTPFFTRDPIGRLDELRFAPWEVFSYYIFWFADFLTSDESKEEADSASCFLDLVLEKARAEPEKFRELYPRLEPAVVVVAGRQDFYDAEVELYGLFSDHKREIEAELASK